MSTPPLTCPPPSPPPPLPGFLACGPPPRFQADDGDGVEIMDDDVVLMDQDEGTPAAAVKLDTAKANGASGVGNGHEGGEGGEGRGDGEEGVSTKRPTEAVAGEVAIEEAVDSGPALKKTKI